MKLRTLLVLCLLLVVGLVARSSDYFLLPDNFFLQKGETLTLHLLFADMFDKQQDIKYQPANTGKFVLHEGSKTVDLKSSVKDADSVLLRYKIQSSGLYMAELTQTYPAVDLDRGALVRELDDQGLTKLSEKANASFQQDIKEKYTTYLKTLFVVDKSSGNVFSKELGQELEIVLLQNPYKVEYGDDITAIVKFKGQPLKGANVDLLTKSVTGKAYIQRLVSDATGSVFFKLNREGSYLIRTTNIEASKAPGIDYEKWSAAYTFGFRTALLKNY